ncbi:MAG TPA: thioredoxin domain-containing protein [Pyrinomonadaceae bacterium]|nr:thioredoxin domain-containing protein [Pyrinomonadaceae bacterium]
MKVWSTLITIVLLLTVTVVSAQTTRRSRTARRPAADPPATSAQPTPAPTPSGPPVSPAPPDPTIPTNLAILDGQTITISDIDPAVGQEIAKLGEKIAQARREMLDVQINTVLLEIESGKRKVPAQTFYDLEVAKKITEPTEAEINALIEQNKAQLGQADPASFRNDAITFLKSEKEQKLSQDLVNRLKVTSPVVFVADLNSPDLKPTTVVATVGDQQVLAGTIQERMKPVMYSLRLSAYQVTRDALNRTLNDLLLLAEAKRRNIPPENVIRLEVTEKARNPTDAEAEKFYNDNKDRIAADFISVKSQIVDYLREKGSQDLERALSERLRKTANLRILLTEPEAPVYTIDTTGEPSRGDANAPVTVIEFTDFQCPACAAMQPILDEILPTYGSKVRFVVRNYPLARHANARKAAEAADAANAQGKFFEYTAVLFKRQTALDVPSLKKYASEVGLDRARFDAELDKGMYAADIRRDMDAAEKVGIGSTPTVFINGTKLYDMTPEGLRAAIDKALAKAGR